MRILLLGLAMALSAVRLSAQKPLLTIADSAVVDRDGMSAAAPPVMAESWNQVRTKFIDVNFGFALLLDHTVVNQDEINIAQVGDIEPATEFRGDRFILSGTMRVSKAFPWRYMISANFNGLDAEDGRKNFEFIDWNIEIPFGAKGGWLTLGKQKEGVGHEYVAPGTQLMFMERGSGVPMLVRQRNVGLRYSNNFMDKRMTMTAGFFNNYWETGKSFSANGSQVTARVTGLPVYGSDRRLLHIGLGYRYTEPTDGQLTYKARPEANSAPHYINTGAFAADGANTFMVELIGVHGPFTLMAEYMNVAVKSPVAGDPGFLYWQVGGSWFVTGENRRYNKVTGNLGKLIPARGFTFLRHTGPGAVELAARYTHTDARSEFVDGGILGRFTGAVSWYLNAHMRLSVNYGTGALDKSAAKGTAQFWQFRAQFEI